jgi:hypothetical protein
MSAQNILFIVVQMNVCLQVLYLRFGKENHIFRMQTFIDLFTAVCLVGLVCFWHRKKVYSAFDSATVSNRSPWFSLWSAEARND